LGYLSPQTRYPPVLKTGILSDLRGVYLLINYWSLTAW
jgi:hypothetical protein